MAAKYCFVKTSNHVGSAFVSDCCFYVNPNGVFITDYDFKTGKPLDNETIFAFHQKTGKNAIITIDALQSQENLVRGILNDICKT